jgi:hypothetical protein
MADDGASYSNLFVIPTVAGGSPQGNVPLYEQGGDQNGAETAKCLFHAARCLYLNV